MNQRLEAGFRVPQTMHQQRSGHVDDVTQRCPLASGKQLRYILNHMVQHSQSQLDASFGALSDTTRRGVLEQLGRAEASITDLAEKFHMTLTGMKKHVGVLEQA